MPDQTTPTSDAAGSIEQTTRANRVHCSISIAKFGAELGLSTCDKLLLYTLWSQLPDPFAERPRVTLSYGRIADLVGLSKVSVPRIMLRLVRLGCLTRLPPSSSGTTYVLERPEHDDADADASPFGPSAATLFAEAVAEIVEPRIVARVRNRKAKARERPKKIKLAPSMIALELEDMAGVEPKIVDGKRRATVRFSGRGAGAVQAAQRWIGRHSVRAFRDTLARASQHTFVDLTTPTERLYLFDRPRALAELQGLPVPSSTEGERADASETAASEPSEKAARAKPASAPAVERPRLRERLAELGCVDVREAEVRLGDFADARGLSVAEQHELLDDYLACADRKAHALHEVLS